MLKDDVALRTITSTISPTPEIIPERKEIVLYFLAAVDALLVRCMSPAAYAELTLSIKISYAIIFNSNIAVFGYTIANFFVTKFHFNRKTNDSKTIYK